ncbi:hypothetical protein J5500_03770 [Candidatus Saccharibacteria bacterium]|nr:hypothetical protein [Candidatus Saccharibacteria bacterium]
MEKQRSIQFAIIGALSFAVLFMSIGFATYSQVIDLNSPAAPKLFGVELDEDSYQLGEGSVEPTSLSITDKSIDFGAHLEKPGDYYLFSIKAVNNGNFDGLLDNVWMTTPDASIAPFVDYTVYYNNEDTFTCSKFGLNYAINKNAGMDTKSVMVKVLYNPEEDAEIPADGIDFDFNLTLDYVQSV